MVALREETREWLAGFKAEVKKTKAEWVDDATYIGAAARAAREANERQRRKVASMARRTLFKRTQAAAFRRWAARARENAAITPRFPISADFRCSLSTVFGSRRSTPKNNVSSSDLWWFYNTMLLCRVNETNPPSAPLMPRPGHRAAVQINGVQ